MTASRLDRCYCSHQDDWLPHLCSGTHLSKSLGSLAFNYQVGRSHIQWLHTRWKEENLVWGAQLFTKSLFKKLVKEAILKLEQDVDSLNLRAWHKFVRSIHTVIKKVSPKLKKVRDTKHQQLEEEVQKLIANKQERTTSDMEHKRRLEAKALLVEAHLEDVKKTRLLARELHLKPEATKQAHFFWALN